MRLAWLGAAFALLVMSLQPAMAAGCDAAVVELRGEFGTARFRVDVADTPETRAQGLMFVEQMPRMSGMLFVYERPQPARFWMENTLIPLDIIFADAAGVVQHIHRNAIPLDRTRIMGGDAIQFVLEINGGMSDALGLGVGNVLRHPAIDQGRAAWPCVAP